MHSAAPSVFALLCHKGNEYAHFVPRASKGTTKTKKAACEKEVKRAPPRVTQKAQLRVRMAYLLIRNPTLGLKRLSRPNTSSDERKPRNAKTAPPL